ncbi:MAG TPA: histidine kinase, partial [Cyanothece sp. UBA12306]|nr:histidine kinase [Cyanothece sp. UBA12306]
MKVMTPSKAIMSKRSLSCSPEGIVQARQAIAAKGWTQEELASAVGLSSRQSIWKFLTGRPIKRQIFQEICFTLQLNLEEIVNLQDYQSQSPNPLNIAKNSGIEAWVDTMRDQLRDLIINQCNKLQSCFNLTQPSLGQVYVGVNLLTKPQHQIWYQINTS